MAQFVVSFAVSYLLTRLSQPNGPRVKDLRGFSADYNGVIPLNFGAENRATELTVIWATKIIETKHKHKPALDYAFGIIGALLPSQKTYTYSVSFACLVGGNPIRRIVKIWANKKVIFDAGASTALVFTRADGTHKDFDTLRVYQGDFTQMPDPTIEADKGMGNVSGYRGSAFFVIDTLQLKNFGNAVPYSIEALVEEAETATLRRVVLYLASASGIDPNSMSTTSLDGEVRGYRIDSPVTVADAFSPLAQVFAFDVADITGNLRFVPRGRYPQSIVAAEHLGGHAPEEEGDERPEPIRFTRAPEIGLPQELTVKFSDPARDYQPNSAVARRQGGSSQANLVFDTGLVIDAGLGQDAADRGIWEAWASRQTATATTDDRRIDIGATDVHIFETPLGLDTFRVTRRTRGANGVIELQLEADRPLIYPGGAAGVPAPTTPTTAGGFTPLNPPIFIEPPGDMIGDTPQLWIALSGGSGVLASGGSTFVFDPAWPGVNIFIATADVDNDYREAGAVDTASYMGFLTAGLGITSGASPDVTGELKVDLEQSGGVLESVSAADAASGLTNLYFIANGSGGEFLAAQDAVATHPYNYLATTLYRGLHGSDELAHSAGANFAVIDDALARISLPPEMIGVPLFFRFPQPGQALADAATYTYTPTGLGFGTGPGGVPAAPTNVQVSASGTSALITWDINAAADNVTVYDVLRADGLGASIGSATLIGSTTSPSFTDVPLVDGSPYTWFVVPQNAVGSGSATAVDTTTGAGTGALESLGLALTPEGNPISLGVKQTISWPYDFTLTEVQAFVTDPQATGATLTIDILAGSGASIFGAPITIDNGERSSLDATTPPTIASSFIPKGQVIEFEVIQVGDGTGQGLKVFMVGRQT